MFYTFNHEGRIEQGDICFNLPKFVPSNLISEELTESTWDIYIESIRKREIPEIKFSFFPSPTWGVILTQTCDIENSKEDASIIFAELKNYYNSQNIDDLSEKKKKSQLII